MAKLQIQIKTDRPDLKYVAGQTLSAIIQLHSPEKIKITKLTVNFYRDKENRNYLGPSGTIATNLTLEAKTSKKLNFEFIIPAYLENLPDTLFMEVRAEIEEGTPKTNTIAVKLSGKDASLSERAGNGFVAILFSAIFFGFAALGVVLWLNGNAGKEIPYAVQWFGLACIAGGMFVAQKMMVGMKVFSNPIMGVLYLALAVTGFYVGIFNPDFLITDPVFACTGPHSLLKMFHFASDADIRAAHGLILGLMSLLFAADAFVASAKKGAYIEFMISIPMLTAGLIASVYAWGMFSAGGYAFSQQVVLPLIVAGVGLGTGIAMCVRPSWQNAHRYIVLAGAGPLLLLAIAESVSGGEGSGFGVAQSRVLAALLAISSGLIFYFGNRNMFAEMRLGKVNLVYSSLTIPPGGSIVAQLDFTPRKQANLNRIRTRLLCYETVRYRFDDETRYNTNKLLDRQLDFPINQSIEAGKPFAQTIEVGIPMGMPVSTGDTQRTVWWEFDFVLMVDGAPDWSSRETIEVKVE